MSHYAATKPFMSIDVPLNTIEIQTLFLFGKNTLNAKNIFVPQGVPYVTLYIH